MCSGFLSRNIYCSSENLSMWPYEIESGGAQESERQHFEFSSSYGRYKYHHKPANRKVRRHASRYKYRIFLLEDSGGRIVACYPARRRQHIQIGIESRGDACKLQGTTLLTAGLNTSPMYQSCPQNELFLRLMFLFSLIS